MAATGAGDAKADDEIARLKADAEMPIEDLMRMYAQRRRRPRSRQSRPRREDGEEEGTESGASLSDNGYISSNMDDSNSSGGEDEEFSVGGSFGATAGDEGKGCAGRLAAGAAGASSEGDVWDRDGGGDVVEERRSRRPARRRRATEFGTVDTPAAATAAAVAASTVTGATGSFSTVDGGIGEGKRLVREVLPWRSEERDGEIGGSGGGGGSSFKGSERIVREEHMQRSMSESMSLSSEDEDEEEEGRGSGDPDVDGDVDAEFEFRDEVDDETTLEAEVGWKERKTGIGI